MVDVRGLRAFSEVFAFAVAETSREQFQRKLRVVFLCGSNGNCFDGVVSSVFNETHVETES